VRLLKSVVEIRTFDKYKQQQQSRQQLPRKPPLEPGVFQKKKKKKFETLLEYLRVSRIRIVLYFRLVQPRVSLIGPTLPLILFFLGMPASSVSSSFGSFPLMDPSSSMYGMNAPNNNIGSHGHDSTAELASLALWFFFWQSLGGLLWLALSQTSVPSFRKRDAILRNRVCRRLRMADEYVGRTHLLHDQRGCRRVAPPLVRRQPELVRYQRSPEQQQE